MALNGSEGTQVRKGHHIQACVCDWHEFFFLNFKPHRLQGGGSGFSSGAGKVMTQLAAQVDSSTSLGSSDRRLYLLILSINK